MFGSKFNRGSDPTPLLDHGMPRTGYGTRKLPKDVDVAIAYCPLFLVADLAKPEVPWSLWGYTMSNFAEASIRAAVNHKEMTLGFLRPCSLRQASSFLAGCRMVSSCIVHVPIKFSIDLQNNQSTCQSAASQDGGRQSRERPHGLPAFGDWCLPGLFEGAQGEGKTGLLEAVSF